ncbi:Rieske 2Fe-2S domain-containing protein [Micromonospora sp. NPDC049559]|uniref:QcrA and Rieske domain-containing protein n=1 Tax=Micromonospora sp. NPDC049559 TaxID=3155923 RepID=UPI003429BFE0
MTGRLDLAPAATPEEDERREAARRERAASRWIGLAFGASACGAAGFAAVYATGGQTQLEGLSLAVAFAGLAAGLGLWSRRLLPSGGYVEEHEPFDSPPVEVRLTTEALAGPESPLRRRGLLGLLTLALGALAGAALFPLRSLLPFDRARPAHALRVTPWAAGVRLVRADGSPVRPDDVPAETFVPVFPEGHPDRGDTPAFAVRLDPARFTTPPPGGHVDGIVVYSLLCTHAGCPVALYLRGTARVLCPCHQSNFDLLAAARAIAGPASRPLPGLPIAVDPAGFLVATGDFTSPPGPGFWSHE